jgi:hypothetical protein
MTKQLFGLFFGWAWRPLLSDGLMDQGTIGLPRPSLIILGTPVPAARCRRGHEVFWLNAL